jgi:hypothetical protein
MEHGSGGRRSASGRGLRAEEAASVDWNRTRRRGWCRRGQSGGGLPAAAGRRGSGGRRKRRRRARVWEETTAAFEMGRGRESGGARGGNPGPGRVGQPAGAQRRPPRGWPMGERGGAGKTEGAADARARARGEREERLTGGAGRKENIQKRMAQLQKSKNGTSWAPKLTKLLLKQDHTTKNIMQ